ncbi:MAG: hypothetical protein WEA56_13350 [Balneolaceae bacterium]
MKRFTILPTVIGCFLMFILADSAGAQHQEHGKVDFETSCNEQAEQFITNGIALIHHMMYEQAEINFEEAVSADPSCATAHWGIAMTVVHPLWGERPSDENLEKGFKAIEKAMQLNPQTEREAGYISALEPFFRDWKSTSYPEQLAAFENGFQILYETYPDDVDAAAFYALGQLATAPKDDQSFSKQEQAGQLLEEFHAKAPEHPGLFHYIIHAYDNPVLAEKAVDAASGYDKIAPDVPHALHMPSHIFVRLGHWQDVVDWNQRSADAALRQPVNGMVSMHYLHALDYMMYAYLQQGEDNKAAEVMEKAVALDNLQQTMAAAYAMATIQARYPLELNNWEEAASIEPRSMNTISWDTYSGAESISWFARGLGAARSGNAERAGEAIEALEGLYSKLKQEGEDYWAVLTEAHSLSVEAWLEYADGNREQAVELMKYAADLEDSVDKHPVTPGHVLPARELLGDMYLLANQPEKALQAYERSLEISENRFNSLYGAGRAAQLAGNDELAKNYYSQLIENCQRNDIARPHFVAASGFMSNQ